MTTGCFESIHISNNFPAQFRFAAFDYTAPHHQDFEEEFSDFLHYAVHRDGITELYCVTSPPGLALGDGPQAATPPPGLLRLPGLRTRFVSQPRTLELSVGGNSYLVWFITNRLRIILDPLTGAGDIYVPFSRGSPVTVELLIAAGGLRHQVTEYHTPQACAKAA